MNKIFAGGFGVLLSVFLAADAGAMGKPPSQVEIGLKAPDFLYQKAGGEPVSFSDFRAAHANKITAVCFLSYDCPFSRMVMKSAAKFFEDNKENVAAVGISPMPYETKELLAQYKNEQGIPFDLYWDQSGELTNLFHVGKVPEFFVYDRQGVLRFRGGIGGMKNAVAGLVKGESNFAVEGELLGCAVPQRHYKPPKEKKAAISKTTPTIAPAPVPVPAVPKDQNTQGKLTQPSSVSTLVVQPAEGQGPAKEIKVNQSIKFSSRS